MDNSTKKALAEFFDYRDRARNLGLEMSHKLKPCPRCGANMPVVGGGGGGGGRWFIVHRCSNEACRHELTEGDNELRKEW